MKYKKVLKELTDIGERQGKNAVIASRLVKMILDKHNIDYVIEKYKVDLPIFKSATLFADDKKIQCKGTGLTSGSLTSNENIASSLISSKYFLNLPHINFNPKSKAISKANYSFAPSIAVNRKDILRISKAKKIAGNITVDRKTFDLPQILVGNTIKPDNIIFSHFDSIEKGAIDNASGTVVMLDIIIDNPGILKKTLFVFDGNEEVSFDKPIYWGKGYRNFQFKYTKQVNFCKSMLVVDCIGHGKPMVMNQEKFINLAFPLNEIKKHQKKIRIITADFEKLMKVYHSDDDTSDLIIDKYYFQTKKLIQEIIAK